MKKDFTVEIIGKGAKVNCHPTAVELRPTHLYVIPNGTLDEKMSFVICLSALHDPIVLGQISAQMLIGSMPDDLLRQMKKYVTDELVKRVRANNEART